MLGLAAAVIVAASVQDCPEVVRFDFTLRLHDPRTWFHSDEIERWMETPDRMEVVGETLHRLGLTNGQPLPWQFDRERFEATSVWSALNIYKGRATGRPFRYPTDPDGPRE